VRSPSFVAHQRPRLDVESWSENLDDVCDVPAHLNQVGEEEAVFRIAQRYLDGLVTLHLHLRVRARGLDEDAHEFCAVVASRRGRVGHAEDPPNILDEAGMPRESTRIFAFGAVGDGDRNGLSEGTADMREAVLVHIVKPRKKGRGTRAARVSPY
jgi:hypothetical protein